MSGEELEQTLRELEHQNLEALRGTWSRHFGAPPRFRSTDLFRRMLAFELQSSVYGGLSPNLKLKLRAKGTYTRKPRLQPGTVITREWRGERHLIHVQDGTYEHLGCKYRSLSQIARVITGVKWSGPRFFGLTADESKAA